MSGTIFLIGSDGLQEMKQQPYESEAMLQKDLAKYPNLLAGDQINQSDPRRWLLIKREMGVPGEEDGSDRWAVDHLFLDQDGIPTLVEIKRSIDTRSRREVVAQMLDYAANATAYWSVVQIQAAFEATCTANGDEPIPLLMSLLRPETDERVEGADEQDAEHDVTESDDDKMLEDYWEKVKTNLQAEKIRLIFMADRIQPELKRIVEFLNGQMDPAEVLAVQIPQFVRGDQKVLVPTVLGQTLDSIKRKTTPVGPTPDWEKVWEEKLTRLNPAAVEPCKEILKWADKTPGVSIKWAGGPVQGSFWVMAQRHGSDILVISVEIGVPKDRKSEGVRGYFQYGKLRKVPPFTDKSTATKMVEELNRIGLDMYTSNLDDGKERYPGFSLTPLQNKESMKQFLETLEWIVKQIQEPPEPTPEP